MFRKKHEGPDGESVETGNWIVKIRWRGKPCQITTGTKEEGAADSMETTVRELRNKGIAEVLEPLFAGLIPLNRVHRLVQTHGYENAVKPILQEVRAAQSTEAWEDSVDEFLSHQKIENGTKATYRRGCLEFGEFIREEYDEEPSTSRHLTLELVDEFKDWALERRLDEDSDQRALYAKGATVNRLLTGIQAYCTYLLGTGMLRGENPARSHKKGLPHGVKRLPEYINEDPSPSAAEWKVIRGAAVLADESRQEEREALGEHDGPEPGVLLWDVLVNTGFLVYKECINQLTPASFNLLAVKDGAVPVRVFGTKTSWRSRTVYVAESLARRVREYAREYGIGPKELLFSKPGANGTRIPFSTAEVGSAWDRVMQRVPEMDRGFVEDYNPFHLRHAYARFQIESGVTIATLNRLLGHSPKSIAMTLRYARYAPDNEARAAIASVAERTGLAG